MNHTAIACRFASLLVAVTLAPTAIAAEGDPCVADADCGVGYACNLPPTAGDGAGVGGSSGSERSAAGGAAEDPVPPVAGTGGDSTERPETPVGECRRARLTCVTDADCGNHYVCEFDSSDVACAAGSDCTDVPFESPTGECYGEPMACSANTDCPESSNCVDQLCTFEPVECTDDVGCPSDYECMLSVTEECSVSPCAAGESCDPEPTCTTTSTNGVCFPKPIPCSSDADCSGGWLCYDVPNEDAPDDWAEVDKGCLPAGIVGAIEGYVEVGGALAESENDSGESAPIRGPDNGNTETASGDPGDAPAAKAEPSADDGGCAVTVAGAGRGPGRWLLVAAGLLVGLLRARRRA